MLTYLLWLPSQPLYGREALATSAENVEEITTDGEFYAGFALVTIGRAVPSSANSFARKSYEAKIKPMGI